MPYLQKIKFESSIIQQKFRIQRMKYSWKIIREEKNDTMPQKNYKWFTIFQNANKIKHKNKTQTNTFTYRLYKAKVARKRTVDWLYCRLWVAG